MGSSEKLSLSLSQAILLEVAAAPKPGLVTRQGNGSHRDMSILTFAMSSVIVSNAFYKAASVGREHQGTLSDLLKTLRPYGVEAEKALLGSTKQVNTQRGILFAGSLLAGAAGFLEGHGTPVTVSSVCEAVMDMTSGIVDRELRNLQDCETRTAGEKLFRQYRITGIRGEAEQGFPSVRNYGLPALQDALAKGRSLNDACVHALIALMSVVEDSNVVWRAGYESLLWLQKRARIILGQGSVYTDTGYAAIQELDRDCVERRISPGGSADLLSLTLALYLLENTEFPGKVM